MTNIAALQPDQIVDLISVLEIADRDERSFRLLTGSDKHGPWFKYSLGGGMWTPNIYTAWVE